MGMFDDFNTLFHTKWGLDFGTYRSMVAYTMNSEAPKTPQYRDENLGGVPSVFWRDENGNEYVGDQVLERNGIVRDPEGVCPSVKMKLGENSITLHGKSYSPTEIAVRLVQRILEVSRSALQQEFIEMDFDEIVVGYPVRFNAADRGELEAILKTATNGKHIRLVHEPILAALANDYFSRRIGRRPRTTLVFDMGAGTFDCTVIRPVSNRTARKPHPYEELASDGSFIAGNRMDELMIELILDKLRMNPNGISPLVFNNRANYSILCQEFARVWKEQLSGIEEDSFYLNHPNFGSSGWLNITRGEYEAKIRNEIQKNVDIAAQTLARAKLGEHPDVDILLVGGSTYIPLVRKLLEEKFDWIPKENIRQRFPEKAVVFGAALYAAEPEVIASKVIFGYAVETFVSSKNKHMLHVRIGADDELPKTVKGNYYTRYDNQRYVSFPIYEISHGESGDYLDVSDGTRAEDNGEVYEITHDFGRKVPVDTKVELTTTLDQNGVLTMTVDDLGISSETTKKTFRRISTVAK